MLSQRAQQKKVWEGEKKGNLAESKMLSCLIFSTAIKSGKTRWVMAVILLERFPLVELELRFHYELHFPSFIIQL